MDIIPLYFANNKCANKTALLFNEKHQVENFKRLVNKKWDIEKPVVNEAGEEAVLRHFHLDPNNKQMCLGPIELVSKPFKRRLYPNP
ncbi:hypothetical protein JTB14_014365 [Gonioctena quinquepunctata]|nr:hypothetical protein JTB14_014365 [Gonioctena quinquepunctata]